MPPMISLSLGIGYNLLTGSLDLFAFGNHFLCPLDCVLHCGVISRLKDFPNFSQRKIGVVAN
jgi:hypothetical protein